MIHSYKDLLVWQRAVDLVVEVYKLTENFPKSELYSLSSQMKRAAVSIPSNIAEGRRRNSKKDFLRFVFIAYASGAELETQIIIAKRLSFCDNEKYKQADKLLDQTMRMLNAFSRSLRS